MLDKYWKRKEDCEFTLDYCIRKKIMFFFSKYHKLYIIWYPVLFFNLSKDGGINIKFLFSIYLRKQVHWARDPRDTAQGRARASQPRHFHGKQATRARHPKEYGMRSRGPEGNRIAVLDTRVAVARVWGVCNLNHATVKSWNLAHHRQNTCLEWSIRIIFH